MFSNSELQKICRILKKPCKTMLYFYKNFKDEVNWLSPSKVESHSIHNPKYQVIREMISQLSVRINSLNSGNSDDENDDESSENESDMIEMKRMFHISPEVFKWRIFVIRVIFYTTV